MDFSEHVDVEKLQRLHARKQTRRDELGKERKRIDRKIELLADELAQIEQLLSRAGADIAPPPAPGDPGTDPVS